MTKDQVSNVLRHVGSITAGIITLGGTLAVLSASGAVDAQIALKDIIDGLSQAWDGAWRLGVIIGPVLAGVMMRWGHVAVSPPAQAISLSESKPDGSVKVLVAPNATAGLVAVSQNKNVPNVVEVPPDTPTVKGAVPG